MPTHLNSFRLQELLRKHLELSGPQLAELNAEAVRTNENLEQVVTRRGLLTRRQLQELTAQQLGVPCVDVSTHLIDPELLNLVPAELARRYQMVPLFQINGTLTIAMANPEDIAALDELHQTLRMQINPALADPDALRTAVEQSYPLQPDTHAGASAIADEVDEALRSIESEDEDKPLEELASEAPVVRLVNSLLERAVAGRASDIHIEPDENAMRIRFRIDGILKETDELPPHLHPVVTSRVKIIAGLDISEKRRPQDGKVEVRIGGRPIDIRVSSFPTVYGENLVLRILDKTKGPMGIQEMGMDPEVTASFRDLISRPHGILLVTGPTGSGKTTTLCAVLNAINSIEKNIITLEDPVEYRLPLIRHCQINPKAGITFASGLRSILRQDPDVLMVGEIRDSETAEIAFQAALTGHLVLSTLHTNDAGGALTRMVDMHIEPFLIASSVIAILAQRLVRRVCPDCTEPAAPPESVLKRLGTPAGTPFVRGKGCKQCGDSGYHGRLGVFELLPMTDAARRLLMEGKSSKEMGAQAQRNGMRTLREDALAKALAGLTTAEEVLRVT